MQCHLAPSMKPARMLEAARTGGGRVKASLIRAFMIAWTRPEAGRATYEQGEAAVKRCGGPNPRAVQHSGMTCV